MTERSHSSRFSFQCQGGYHILCRAFRAGYCACRCHLDKRRDSMSGALRRPTRLCAICRFLPGYPHVCPDLSERGQRGAMKDCHSWYRYWRAHGSSPVGACVRSFKWNRRRRPPRWTRVPGGQDDG